MMRLSLTGRVTLAAMLASAVSAGVTNAAIRWTASVSAATLVGVAIALPVAFWAARAATSSWSQVVRAVRDGVMSLRDHDFSVSIARVPNPELRSELVTAYNELGELLRRERLDLYQRELLLDTVIQTTPLVMVLTNSVGRVVYSNVAARRSLLNTGRKLEGLDLPSSVLTDAPTPCGYGRRYPVSSDTPNATGDSLFTMDVAGELPGLPPLPTRLPSQRPGPSPHSPQTTHP